MLRVGLHRQRLLAVALAGAASISQTGGHGAKVPPRERLTIYPKPEPELVLIDTPSELERRIGQAREAVTGRVRDAHAHVQGWVSRWIDVEHSVERRVKSFKADEETLVPGLLYIGVAGLTGSVVARSRSRLSRALLPPTLALGALYYFLPHTAANLGAYYAELEGRYVPRLQEIRTTAVAHSFMTYEMGKAWATEQGERFGEGVGKGVRWTEDTTGLKLREALGWAKEQEGRLEAQVEAKAVEAKEGLDKRYQDAKAAVEKKVEEVKRLV